MAASVPRDFSFHIPIQQKISFFFSPFTGPRYFLMRQLRAVILHKRYTVLWSWGWKLNSTTKTKSLRWLNLKIRIKTLLKARWMMSASQVGTVRTDYTGQAVSWFAPDFQRRLFSPVNFINSELRKAHKLNFRKKKLSVIIIPLRCWGFFCVLY